MPKIHPPLTAERLRELLSYDLEIGQFRWIKPRRGVVVGSIAGSDHGSGYLRIRIEGRFYFAHRLAWLYVYGKWPTKQLDHRNGVRSDNKIKNLREATNAENSQNRAISVINKSGHPGICWNEKTKKWRARIQVSGRYRHVGCFTEIDDAVAARAKAKAQLHTFQPTMREAT